jgi:hypothetical protein
VLEVSQEDGFAKHFVDFAEAHAGALEDFHGLAAQEAVLNAIDLGKGPFPEKALDFVSIADGWPCSRSGMAQVG